MKNKILYLLLLLPFLGTSQQDYIASQYMYNGIFLNPAYTGTNELQSITALYRKQWVKLEGAPTSQLIGYDLPLKEKNMGLSLVVGNDQIGVSNQSDVFVNYAYHLKLNTESHLSFGLKAGTSIYQANLSELKYWDNGDPIFENNVEGSVMPNFGFGAYYYTDKYYVGLSIPHLLNYNEGGVKITRENTPNTIRHYYLNAGYIFGEGDFLYKPSVLGRYVKGAPFQADINFSVLYKQRISLGVSYRTGDSFIGLAQFYVLPQLRIGYSYDATLTDIRIYSKGSHEISATYEFGKSKEYSVRFF